MYNGMECRAVKQRDVKRKMKKEKKGKNIEKSQTKKSNRNENEALDKYNEQRDDWLVLHIPQMLCGGEELKVLYQYELKYFNDELTDSTKKIQREQIPLPFLCNAPRYSFDQKLSMAVIC